MGGLIFLIKAWFWSYGKNVIWCDRNGKWIFHSYSIRYFVSLKFIMQHFKNGSQRKRNSTSLQQKENLLETDISILGNFHTTGSVCEIMSPSVNRHFSPVAKVTSLRLSTRQLFCFQGTWASFEKSFCVMATLSSLEHNISQGWGWLIPMLNLDRNLKYHFMGNCKMAFGHFK